MLATNVSNHNAKLIDWFSALERFVSLTQKIGDGGRLVKAWDEGEKIPGFGSSLFTVFPAQKRNGGTGGLDFGTVSPNASQKRPGGLKPGLIIFTRDKFLQATV